MLEIIKCWRGNYVSTWKKKFRWNARTTSKGTERCRLAKLARNLLKMAAPEPKRDEKQFETTFEKFGCKSGKIWAKEKFKNWENFRLSTSSSYRNNGRNGGNFLYVRQWTTEMETTSQLPWTDDTTCHLWNPINQNGYLGVLNAWHRYRNVFSSPECLLCVHTCSATKMPAHTDLKPGMPETSHTWLGV